MPKEARITEMATKKSKLTKRTIWGTIKHIPRRILQYFRIKFNAALNSKIMLKQYVPVLIHKSDIAAIEENLKRRLKDAPATQPAWTTQEQQIIKRIKYQTKHANRNNVTRTLAYYEVYRQFPELHWAFLAHMVSRNGGWSMTDLKGDLIPRLMSSQQVEYLFLFLERANSFIFYDAYPQLLLYIESKKQQKNMFHLLPQFHVSIWMRVIWDHEWNHPNSSLLTAALIVNEQHYIEQRVVQDSSSKKYVIDELYFKAQALLQLNQVVFPSKDHVVGLILEDFTDLHERIEFGKQLYCILFGFPMILSETTSFATRVKHSGSRADYWPHLYQKHRNSASSPTYSEKLKGCQILEGAEPFYSPELLHAWKDRLVDTPQIYDWCTDLSPLDYLHRLQPPRSFDMTEEHCYGLNKIELAVLTKKKL